MIRNDLLRQLNSVKVVSFDIFDTLILRNVEEPTDVFHLVERRFNLQFPEDKIANYRKLRIQAEQRARKQHKNGEITLDNIYEELHFNVESKQILKQLELDTEEKVCVANPEITEIYRWCIDNKKKVILVSDMYLPQQTIEVILNKAEICEYDGLFVSSVYGQRKSTGRLYEIVKDKLKVQYSDILHIGDNEDSDIRVPNILGIHTVYIRRKKYSSYFTQKDKYRSSIVNGYLKNLILDNDFYSVFGYSVLGPMLYGYIKWLRVEVEKESPDKLLFMSRDGRLMYMAYSALYPDDKRAKYVYGSRRAIVPAAMSENCTVDFISQNVGLGKYATVRNILKFLGFDVSVFSEQLEKAGLNEDDIVYFQNLLNDGKFVEFFSLIRDDILSQEKKEFFAAREYWDNVVQNGGTYFVADIGWGGYMIAMLKQLLDDKVQNGLRLTPYFFGVILDSKYRSSIHSYAYDEEYHREYEKIFRNLCCIFETMFMCEHGSVKRYVSDGSFVEFEDSEYRTAKLPELVNEIECIDKYQKSAIQFVVDFDKYYGNLEIDFRAEDAVANFFNACLFPSRKTSYNFGRFRFRDSDGFHYLGWKNADRFSFSEFRKSRWREGYLGNWIDRDMNYHVLVSMWQFVSNLVPERGKIIIRSIIKKVEDGIRED